MLEGETWGALTWELLEVKRSPSERTWLPRCIYTCSCFAMGGDAASNVFNHDHGPLLVQHRGP